jgi:circadian clock protein KaiC
MSCVAKMGIVVNNDNESLGDDDLRRISTGNAGLDEILGGGVDPERMYLFEGQPGSGKTTLALEFLLEGVRRGEPTLYITLSETERELRLVAKRHGWSLKGITIFELIPPETSLDPSQELTVLHPAEMELSETTQMIFDRVEALAPARIVLDSLSELRLLAQSPLRYRRQILALKHFFSGRSLRWSCSTTSPHSRTICNCIRLPMASCCLSSWRSTTGRRGGAFGS